MTSQPYNSATTPSTTSTHALAKRLISTSPAYAPLLIRVTLAAIMLPHGAQKLLGWFGGYGFSGTMQYFTQSVGLPWIVAAGAILLEFLGSIALLFGAGTRAIAAGFIGIMLGAIVTTHAQFGFFMNWSGQLGGEGFEYHLLVIGMAASLLLSGAGRLSVDLRLHKRA